MKKIMFLFHAKEREYGIIRMIKEQIQIIDPATDIRIGEFYSSITQTIEFMPDVIVSIPPRDYYGSNYLTMLKVITGAVVISMNTEGYYSFTVEEKQVVTGFNRYAKELVDYYLVWGEKTKKELGAYWLKDNKVTDLRRVKVIGYANYELDKVRQYNEKNYSCEELKDWINQYEKCILAITGFVTADIGLEEYQQLGLFGDGKKLTDRTVEEKEAAKRSIYVESECRRKYVEQIIAVAEKNPQIGFIIKMHPIELGKRVTFYNCLSKYKNIFLIKEQIPIGILLPKVSGMIHYNSTCMLEAYIYNVPTIQMYESKVKTSYKFTWQDKSNSTYLIDIDDKEALGDIIEQGLKFTRNTKQERVLYEQFDWKKDRAYKPIEKTAYYILQAKKKQRLKFFDKEVKKAIESEQGKRVIKSIQYTIIQKLSSNRNFVKEIVQLVKIYMYKYLCNIRRC